MFHLTCFQFLFSGASCPSSAVCRCITLRRVGTATRVKIYWRRLWEYQKWKVWIPPTRAGCWEAELNHELLLRIPGADLSLLPLPAFLPLPQKAPNSSICRRYPRAVQTYWVRSWLQHRVRQNDFAEGLYKTELRETTQTTSTQWRNAIPAGEKEAAPLSTQLHCSPCSSKPECLHLTCLLDGPWNELGTVLSMGVV